MMFVYVTRHTDYTETRQTNQDTTNSNKANR